MRVRDVDDARAFLADRGFLPLLTTGAVTGLVDLVAGEAVSGHWWGHPAGKQIFHIVSALEDHPDVLAARVLDGRMTFVDRHLFAPLYRVVTDPEWRKEGIRTLHGPGKKLLETMPSTSTRLEALALSLGLDKKAVPRAKEELEKSLLVRVWSARTEDGKHTAFLGPWSAWADSATKRDARALELHNAQAVLREAAGNVRTLLTRHTQ